MKEEDFLSEHIECVENHLAEYFDEDEMTVFHEIFSPGLRMDVYYIKPKSAKFNLLVTSGMSGYAMKVPEAVKQRKDLLYAELMIIIPKDVEFSPVHTGEGGDKNAWYISMLKQTARFPHLYETFLTIGHTLQATEDLKPYSDETDFVACMVLPSVTFDEDFTKVMCGENKINIYSLFPLYQNELEFKVRHGYNAFVGLLQKGNPEEKINNKRENLIRK